MSMNKKLDDAFLRGKIQECARVLWIMDDMRTKLRQGLEKVILVEAKRHAMQVKVNIAISIFETIKMRLMAGDKPPDAPVSPEAVEAVDDLIAHSTEPNICPKCGAFGYRYAGSCPHCDDVVSETKEKANGQTQERPDHQGSDSEPPSGM